MLKPIDNKKDDGSEDDGAWIVKDDEDMDDEPAAVSKPRKDKGASEMYEKVSKSRYKYQLTCSQLSVVAHATGAYLETPRHVHWKYRSHNSEDVDV